MSSHIGETGYLAGREGQLGAIDALRGATLRGRGTGVLVQGAAGVGKTALLRAACERARRAGALVVEAQADRWEADCPLGVVRQLFAGLTETCSASGPEELYDRTMALAAGRPLVIAVDDLRWIDDASARWLAYLLRRLRDRRVLVLATTSLPADLIDVGLLSRFEHHIMLDGLCAEVIVDLAGDMLDTPVEKEFGRACQQATDGTPVLVRAMLRAVRDSGRPVSCAVLGEVLASPPPEVLTWLRGTLATCGSGARALVEVLTALGEPVELELAVATAELATVRVAPLTDALVAARLLGRCRDRVSLRPPLVQAAALAGLAPGAGQALRARAARLLHSRGAPAADIAAHLLRSGPLGEPWAADVLCAVAAQATAEGDTDRALDHLRSALREPMSAQQRSELMVHMGSVQSPADIASAVGYLRRALDIAPDVSVRAGAARRLAGLLCVSERHREGMRVLRNAAEPAHGLSPEVAVSLEVEEALLGMLHLPSSDPALTRLCDRADRTGFADVDDRADLDGLDRAPENDALGIFWSVRAMASGRERRHVVQLASRALDHGLAQMDEASLQHPVSVLTLAVAGELHLALHHADQAVGHARRTRSALGGARALAVRSEVNYRLGRLHDCQNDARACLDTLARFGSRRADGLAMAAAARLAETLADSGDMDGAGQVIGDVLEGAAVPASLLGMWLLTSRGRLHLAKGETRAGMNDLLETGRRLESLHVANPAILPWRSLAGMGYAAVGKNAAARELVEEELTLARRWGSEPAIGTALRAAGRAAKGSAGVALLREAVDTLARSGASLEHARALADLGTALRTTNQLADARHHLRQAATLAEQCGGLTLMRLARAELVAAGARSRSGAHCGVASLTPTERRVASLAAGGLSNREISERLFVVRRTVELHLSSTYRKLGIRGRVELPGALIDHA
ncbi:helix-turn-helix transcriptional regulator [Streptomyces coffeae]|uniref:AAA family ATPase n=1 Tax=Streptomyces coffeae TaxID=621382 RepID=A0ABS1N9F6_9ACTN|nr:LuxR family transcriptional regulator [Streptomyces coffeae]MBL1096668.1 AAA family ATPase [Streptomyces coffeae]